MSIQIERLMEKYPQIFYEVIYYGNREEYDDGTWLYMNPSWYSISTDSGVIHEWSIAEVLKYARQVYQDKDRWIEEHPDETEEIQKILNGEYDKTGETDEH